MSAAHAGASRRAGRAAWSRPALVIGAALLLAAGCDELPTGGTTAPTIDAELRQSLQQWGIVPIGPMPEQDPSLVTLGRALFFDPVLSGNRDISCATCHHPAEALGDGRSLPIGTGGTGVGPARTRPPERELVPRSSPSLLNAGLGLTYVFWDGRLSRGGFQFDLVDGGVVIPAAMPNTLASQALLPLLNRQEMRGEEGDTDIFGAPNELATFADTQHVEIWDAVMARLMSIPQYVELLHAAYPQRPFRLLGVEAVAEALAAFQMEAFTKTQSPFDRYLDRDDAALTLQEKRGALLFFDFERAGCASCHGGPLLGGQGFANAGVPQIGPGVGDDAPLDLGRGRLAQGEFYRFAFRVPPLRNVELTAPYMHNGAFPTLEAVVRHYDDVATELRTFDPSHLDPETRALHHGDAATVSAVLATLDHRLRRPLELTEAESADLVAFLESLTDASARDLQHLAPDAVLSGLPPAH